MLAALAEFAIGSALCGSAKNRGIFLFGRSVSILVSPLPNTHPATIAVQGMGGGGILALTNLVLADLVPLRERGKYSAIFGM